MGRDTTFIDEQFRRRDHDPSDQGEFTENLVFVAMRFDGSSSKSIYLAIQTACERLGLDPERADDRGGSGIVLREIAELIEAAEFLIFDLTDERPNVYYELGYAHGVGNEANDILLVAREGTSLHFDVAPLRVHYYRDLEHLGSLVLENLERMIRSTRG